MRFLLLPFLTIIFSLSAFSQKTKVENLKRFDEKFIHFGFTLGVNTGQFTLDRKAPAIGDSLYLLNVDNQSGFNLGIVSSLHMTKAFSLRFVPTLVFAQRNLTYTFRSHTGKDNLEQRQVESTYIDFPFLVKYRSKRLNNFAAYIIAGAKYSIDLASNENVKNEDINEPIIKLASTGTSAEVGIGTDFFLPYFKFSIELKMSYGLQDVLIHDDTYLSNPIERILPKMFFFSLHFEG